MGAIKRANKIDECIHNLVALLEDARGAGSGSGKLQGKIVARLEKLHSLNSTVVLDLDANDLICNDLVNAATKYIQGGYHNDAREKSNDTETDADGTATTTEDQGTGAIEHLIAH